MKKVLIIVLILTGFMQTQAQDTTKVNILKKNVVEVKEDSEKTEVSLFNDRINIKDANHSDTTSIRIGQKNIEIIEDDGRTRINMYRDDINRWRRKRKPFNGQWAGFELGVNTFHSEDYSLYDGTQYEGNEFMDLRYPQSLEVNLNFLEYNIALKDHRIGIVTGMGFSMNNYKFDNKITIDKGDDGIIFPVALNPENWRKSKLTVSYLTVPLLLEFQFPANGRPGRIFVSGGVVGAVNLGSHTKIKQGNSRSKDRGGFNVNPFKATAMVRVGVRNISLYAGYGLTPLFEDGKGPELYPLSIGLCLLSF